MTGKSGAVLFVHGILGKPEFFGFLYPAVPEGFAVRSLLLKGHGGTARDFGRASMPEWKSQVHDAVVELKKEFGRLVIVATPWARSLLSKRPPAAMPTRFF